MLIDRAIFNEVGGFRPRLFAFFEDVDLGGGSGSWATASPYAHGHQLPPAHGTASSYRAQHVRPLRAQALYTIFKNYEESTPHHVERSLALARGARRALIEGAAPTLRFRVEQPAVSPEPEMNFTGTRWRACWR